MLTGGSSRDRGRRGLVLRALGGLLLYRFRLGEGGGSRSRGRRRRRGSSGGAPGRAGVRGARLEAAEEVGMMEGGSLGVCRMIDAEERGVALKLRSKK